MDIKELLRTLASNAHILLVSVALVGMTLAAINNPNTGRSSTTTKKAQPAVISLSVAPPSSTSPRPSTSHALSPAFPTPNHFREHRRTYLETTTPLSVRGSTNTPMSDLGCNSCSTTSRGYLFSCSTYCTPVN